MTIRYALDFQMMPRLVNENGPLFISRCKEEGPEHIAFLFNAFCSVYGGCEPYSPEQFRITDCPLDDTHNLLYIDLPCEENGGMQSIAYAIVYTPDSEDDAAVLYNVESSMPGFTFLGRMDDSSHLNYGMAGTTLEENLPLIRRIVCGA